MQITYVDNLHSRVGGTRKGYRVVNMYVNARKIGCLFYFSIFKSRQLPLAHTLKYQSIFQFTNTFDW